MKAMLCSCHRHLEADDDEGLVRELLAHLNRDHPVVEVSEARIREIVAANSYRYECVGVYADVTEPDEEFGSEPY